MIPKEFSLGNKVAIITGDRRGWFRDIAIALADAGADIVIAAEDEKAMSESADRVRRLGRKALVVPTDVTNLHQIESMVDKAVAKFGKIDILVNAADVPFAKPVFEVSEEEWQQVLNTNLTAVFLCSKIVSKEMKARKKGVIINIASGLAERGVANFTAYCASKGGVLAFTKALAVELGRDNIRVTAVAPGWLLEEEGQDRLGRFIPLGRRATGEDISTLVAFLASDAASYVSGHGIFVDGGMQTHL